MISKTIIKGEWQVQGTSLVVILFLRENKCSSFQFDFSDINIFNITIILYLFKSYKCNSRNLVRNHFLFSLVFRFPSNAIRHISIKLRLVKSIQHDQEDIEEYIKPFRKQYKFFNLIRFTDWLDDWYQR